MSTKILNNLLQTSDAFCTHNGMTTSKEERIYVRVRSEIKDDFKATAELRGLKPSALIHSLMVKAIREEKDKSPVQFQDMLNKIKSRDRKTGLDDVDEITEEILTENKDKVS